MAIKTIDYKANNEAYFKALKAPQEVGRATNGATLLAVENSDTYEIYYTFDGKVAFRVMMYAKNVYNLDSFDDLKERVKLDFGKLDDTLVDKYLSPHEERLARIQKSIDNEEWTSNGDALFCEYCNKPELAADVRKNRAEYLVRKEERERIKREAERLEREKYEAARKAKFEQEVEQAAIDYKNGKYIKTEMFEELCKRNGVKIPIKTLHYLRENIGTITFKDNRTFVYMKNGARLTNAICTANESLASILQEV